MVHKHTVRTVPSSSRLPPYQEGGGEQGRDWWQELREREDQQRGSISCVWVAPVHAVRHRGGCFLPIQDSLVPFRSTTFWSRSVAVVRHFLAVWVNEERFCFVGCFGRPFVRSQSISRHEPHAVQSWLLRVLCFVLLSLSFPVPLPSIRCDAL